MAHPPQKKHDAGKNGAGPSVRHNPRGRGPPRLPGSHGLGKGGGGGRGSTGRKRLDGGASGRLRARPGATAGARICGTTKWGVDDPIQGFFKYRGAPNPPGRGGGVQEPTFGWSVCGQKNSVLPDEKKWHKNTKYPPPAGGGVSVGPPTQPPPPGVQTLKTCIPSGVG